MVHQERAERIVIASSLRGDGKDDGPEVNDDWELEKGDHLEREVTYQESKSLHDQAFCLVETRAKYFKNEWNRFFSSAVQCLSADTFLTLSAPPPDRG